MPRANENNIVRFLQCVMKVFLAFAQVTLISLFRIRHKNCVDVLIITGLLNTRKVFVQIQETL